MLRKLIIAVAFAATLVFGAAVPVALADGGSNTANCKAPPCLYIVLP